MKGRANYLCLHRLDQLRASPAAPPDFISMMDEWMRTTETGDRAELSDLPEDSSTLARRVGHRRHVPGQRLPAVSATATSPGCASARPKPTS